MPNAEDLTLLTPSDWQSIHLERDQWFRSVRPLSSAVISALAFILLAAAFYWRLWWILGVAIVVVSALVECEGEAKGYDYGYERGFFAGYQRQLDKETER